MDGYKKYVICYFDVLGTSQRIKENIEGTVKSLWTIGHCISKNTDGTKECIIKAFTDNFIIACELDENEPFPCMNAVFQKIGYAMNISLLNNLIMLRGAVCVGNLYIDNDMVIGEGLLRAYDLEEHVCIFPRIVADKSILEYIPTASKELRDYNTYFFKDFDEMVCFNYLRFINPDYLKIKYNAVIKELTIQRNSFIQNNKDREVQKYNWIINYLADYYEALVSGRIFA